MKSKSNSPVMVSRRGRDHWLFPESGKVLPVVRGGDHTAVQSVEDLNAERGRVNLLLPQLVQPSSSNDLILLSHCYRPLCPKNRQSVSEHRPLYM
jgi:hypothetical protein